MQWFCSPGTCGMPGVSGGEEVMNSSGVSEESGLLFLLCKLVGREKATGF